MKNLESEMRTQKDKYDFELKLHLEKSNKEALNLQSQYRAQLD